MRKLRLLIRVSNDAHEAPGEGNQKGTFTKCTVKLPLEKSIRHKISDLVPLIKERWHKKYPGLPPLGEMDLYDNEDRVSPLLPTLIVEDIFVNTKDETGRTQRSIIYAVPKPLQTKSTPKKKRGANCGDSDTSPVKRSRREVGSNSPCQNNLSEVQVSPANESLSLASSDIESVLRRLEKLEEATAWQAVHNEEQFTKYHEFLRDSFKSKDGRQS